MATTTGTVLLNARGMNINGYDCFVNLSKDTSNLSFNWTCYDHEDSPFSGYPILKGTDSSNTKISPCSLAYSNHYSNYILFSYPFNASSSFTMAWWEKCVCFNTSYAQSKNYFNAGMVAPRVDDYIQALAGSATHNHIRLYDQVMNQFTESSTSRYMDTNWHYYTITFSGSTARWFIDGQLMVTRSISSSTISKLSNVRHLIFVTHFAYHYIDDLVFINGQQLFSSNFTVPSTYLLDSSYAKDLSEVKRNNIVLANVDKKLIIPDDDYLKQY